MFVSIDCRKGEKTTPAAMSQEPPRSPTGKPSHGEPVVKAEGTALSLGLLKKLDFVIRHLESTDEREEPLPLEGESVS